LISDSFQVIEKMERETGFEPATSSLGIQTYFESKPLARFCCEFLNLQRLVESAFSRSCPSNEAETRHLFQQPGGVSIDSPSSGSFQPVADSEGYPDEE
jgi:hypothetical protein